MSVQATFAASHMLLGSLWGALPLLLDVLLLSIHITPTTTTATTATATTMMMMFGPALRHPSQGGVARLRVPGALGDLAWRSRLRAALV